MSGEQAHHPQASTAKPERRQLFISYSHCDGEWVERLRRHLRILELRYGLERWDDSRIQAGALWREEIEKALASAQVALLMVSADFLDSDFVTRSELPPLFTAAKQEGLRILWVPLCPCLWKLIPEIEQYQAVIPPGRTVAEMAEVEQERAFVEIAERILSTFQEEAARQARERKEEQERLAREKEALERRAKEERAAQELRRPGEPDGSRQSAAKQAPEAAVLRLQVQSAALLQDGTTFWGRPKWRTGFRSVEVEGYREELGDGVALTMIRIPAGGFVMGSPSGEKDRSSFEGPQHSVRLEGFFLGQTPITQAQWKAVVGWEKVERDLYADPSRFKGANRPVEKVNWQEAVEFCRRVSAHTGRTYALPSEAQWEYACRAGSTTPFFFGETITTELANYDGNYVYGDGSKGTYRMQTTPVGSFPANAWGLQDMHGNVWEWCADHWHENYDFAPDDDRPWLIPVASGDELRLLRGGSWGSLPWYCRSAYRNRFNPDPRDSSIGFRVCCLPPGPS